MKFCNIFKLFRVFRERIFYKSASVNCSSLEDDDEGST